MAESSKKSRWELVTKGLVIGQQPAPTTPPPPKKPKPVPARRPRVASTRKAS